LGADFNHFNPDGWTALHLAAFYGHLGLVEFLLDKEYSRAKWDLTTKIGEKPNDFSEKTAKDLAIMKNRREDVKTIRTTGGRVEKSLRLT
jgi:ankyrin repeat protein